MKRKEKWWEKLIKVILTTLVHFLISVGFVALGWNWLLPKIFVFVPVFSFKQLCFLTLAIAFISTPVTISAGYTRNKILKAVQGEK